VSFDLPACRRRRSVDPVIGPVGARRALALLVIGDAVLGGAFVGVLVRPGDGTERPVRAVTSTTVVARAADPAPVDEHVGALDAVQPEATSTLPAPSTTVVTTTVPQAPTTTTAAKADPLVAEVTTTAPTTTAPTTVPPSTTTPPVGPVGPAEPPA
jgi:hypothetical protein